MKPTMTLHVKNSSVVFTFRLVSGLSTQYQQDTVVTASG